MKLWEERFPCWKPLVKGKIGSVNIYREYRGFGKEYICIITKGHEVDEVKIFYSLREVELQYGTDDWRTENKEEKS